jgi:DNA processing protein
VLALPQAALVKALRPDPQAGRGANDVVQPPAGPHEGVVTWCDEAYPPRLRELFDPPPAVYVRGRSWAAMLQALGRRPTVAVVGARHPSPYGLEMAWLLGAGLARAGVNVVSGMALGIDAQAHTGALEGLGDPSRGGALPDVPVALAGVLGAGVRLAVPRSNEELFADVARRGVLLSEYGWLLPPYAWRFPARNRLIAALADAVVIVEGRATSGALHTAAFALDLGRDVLAVPGEAGRPLSAGPHRLLRDGAHLCESPGDVLALLPQGPWSAAPTTACPVAGSPGSDHAIDPHGPQLPRGSSAGAPGRPDDAASAAARRVLAALQRGAHTADQLARSLTLSPQAVSAALTLLEIDGLIEAPPGGRYRLRRRPPPRRPAAAGPPRPVP